MKNLVLLQSNTIFKTFKYFTKGQLNFLREKGFSVHAICSPNNDAPDFFKKEGVTHKPIQIERDISVFRDISSAFKIILYIIKIKPSIVQGSTPKAGFLTLVSAWICRTPVRIFFMRGVRSSGLSGIKRIFVESMERITCRLSHQVLCTSKSVKREIIEKGICPPEKAKVLHYGTGNGIDTDRFNPNNFSDLEKEKLLHQYRIDKDSIILLFAGRLVKDKGLLELYQAWQILKEVFPNLILLLVGNEESIDPLPPHVIAELKNDCRVIMPGFVEDCAPFYAISALFVLPSYREGIPISVLEASSMCLPVVVSRVTGCVDAVLDNITGKIVDVKDHNDLENGISLYLLNPELRKEHGKSGRNMVIERFRSETIWSSLYEEYLRLYNATQNIHI